MRAYSACTDYNKLIAISQAREISGPNLSYIDKLIEEYGDHLRSLPETSFFMDWEVINS